MYQTNIKNVKTIMDFILESKVIYMTTKKKKKSFSKILLPWIIVAIMSYTVAAFILQFCTSIEISATLTTAYFAFWTVEVVSLAGIKTMKVKGKNVEVKEEVETENEDSEN